MAAICGPQNQFLNTALTVGSGLAAMGVAAVMGAPVLVGGALGAVTGLVSGVANDIFKNIFHMDDSANPMLATVVHIVSSLAVAGIFVLLGASMTFEIAVFIALAGAALAVLVAGIISLIGMCCIEHQDANNNERRWGGDPGF